MRDLVARGVGFQSVQEHIDTTTSGGKLIFHLFASLAEFARDLIRERTNAGLSAARARGRNGGRPKGVDQKKQKAALALKKEGGHSVREICEIVGISRNTDYKYKYTRADDQPLPQKRHAPGRQEIRPAPQLRVMKVKRWLYSFTVDMSSSMAVRWFGRFGRGGARTARSWHPDIPHDPWRSRKGGSSTAR